MKKLLCVLLSALLLLCSCGGGNTEYVNLFDTFLFIEMEQDNIYTPALFNPASGTVMPLCTDPICDHSENAGCPFAGYTQIFTVEDGKLFFDYSLGALPLHICSSPFYVLPIFFLAKKDFIKRVSATFMCTFSLIGGFAVMAFPDSVFGAGIYTNYQSMIHHSMQILVGVCLGLRYGKRVDKDSFVGIVNDYLCIGCFLFASVCQWDHPFKANR